MDVEHSPLETILHRSAPFALALTALFLLPGAAPGQGADALPRLSFKKVLEHSVPEFLSVTVDEDGEGTFEARQLADAAESRSLKLSPNTTQRLFDLAARLDNFQDIDLESHKKVANLGLKTLTYEVGGRRNQVEFNYTLRREASELVELFEKIATVEQHVAALEHAIKYDHLGLPRELLQIQIDLDNKSLAEAELMVPTLQEIARNPRFLHLAQARAQNILHRLHNDRAE